MSNLIAHKFSFGSFVWWLGVVEDRGEDDEFKLGRVKVRIFGYHTKDKEDIPTDHLMWAWLVMPSNNAGISGVGSSPTGIVEGSHVVGFFMDGDNAQMPVIMGTILGIPKQRKPEEGFFDPNGVYPRNGEEEHWHKINETDTNRLSRNENINDTIVQVKKENIDIANQAFGGTWEEKPTPYGAKYPYNHVYESESGHIMEFDDTQGAERIAQWHRAETFYEIHPDGSKVEKIVKDKYEIILGDDYCHIHGDLRVTAQGNVHILVNGDANIEVDGDVREHIHGDYKLNVDGNYTVQINGTHRDNSDTHRYITAPRIDLN